MKTRIATFVGNAAVVAGLAAGLVLGSGSAEAQDTSAGNYFDTRSVPAGSQTGADRYDPYAPVDLGTADGSLRAAGPAFVVTGFGADADDPCSPQRCRAW